MLVPKSGLGKAGWIFLLAFITKNAALLIHSFTLSLSHSLTSSSIMSASASASVGELRLASAHDMHVHLRDGPALRHTLLHAGEWVSE
jgi:hypothetical protein